jgi:hypothetical protein
MALEVYGKTNPIKRVFRGFKSLWDKTVFSDKLKQKQEERRFKQEIRGEAHIEAMKRAKTELKEQYVQEEVDKMKGIKKESNLKKLAREFDISKIGGKEDKISKMLGNSGGMLDDDKISNMMSIEHKSEKSGKKKQKINKGQEKNIDFEDKIKKMLK